LSSLILPRHHISHLIIVYQAASAEDWKVLNLLQRKANQVAALDLGYQGRASLAGKKVVYLLNADDINADELKDAFVIYQGIVVRACHGLSHEY
jgi:hypothetical protein